jgi:hypothetical protein
MPVRFCYPPASYLIAETSNVLAQGGVYAFLASLHPERHSGATAHQLRRGGQHRNDERANDHATDGGAARPKRQLWSATPHRYLQHERHDEYAPQDLPRHAPPGSTVHAAPALPTLRPSGGRVLVWHGCPLERSSQNGGVVGVAP